MVDAAKELEMIRREGFEQQEGKRTRYSGDYGGAPPRSRGYMGIGYESGLHGHRLSPSVQ